MGKKALKTAQSNEKETRVLWEPPMLLVSCSLRQLRNTEKVNVQKKLFGDAECR